MGGGWLSSMRGGVGSSVVKVCLLRLGGEREVGTGEKGMEFLNSVRGWWGRGVVGEREA